MISGVDRYVQIVRCFRDEDQRADRQLEFTQVDVEVSFAQPETIFNLIEPLMPQIFKEIGREVTFPFRRMSYAEAMAKYGSDKPDLRFGLELVECTEYFTDTPFRVFQAPYVGAVVMPGGASQPRRTLDAWQDFAKQRGHRGLAYVLIAEDGTMSGPVGASMMRPLSRLCGTVAKLTLM